MRVEEWREEWRDNWLAHVLILITTPLPWSVEWVRAWVGELSASSGYPSDFLGADGSELRKGEGGSRMRAQDGNVARKFSLSLRVVRSAGMC